MTKYKMQVGLHLLWCLVAVNFRRALGGFKRGPYSGFRETWRATRRVLGGLRDAARQRGRQRVANLVNRCLASGVSRPTLATNPEGAFVLAGWLYDHQKYEEAIALLDPFATPEPRAAKFHGLRGMCYLGLGRYPESLANLTACHDLCPQAARDFTYNLHRAYLHGLRGETDAARAAMAAQTLPPGHGGSVDEGLAAFLAARLAPVLAPYNLKGTVGVVIGCFHNAVGHAILDPFHFIQLNRNRFDNLILVHPPYSSYSPATRLAAYVLDSYVEQIEVQDYDILNFSWQTMGELRHGDHTFLIHNYWSLNRMAFRARTTPDHPMAHGRDYLSLPPRMVARAEAICRRNHLDLSRPIVVVHTREHGYHGLQGQRYRNTDVTNYIPALRRLVDLGYQVVRIGDAKMHSIRRDVPGLLELPATDFYDPILDPYLISRCRFMISCQSGPCSYARVFGKPNLVLNAVYHYTLLPEHNELIAFKQYRDAGTGRALSVDEVFRATAHLFNQTEHFITAGIELEDMTREEILAATEEMLAWLDNPARPEAPSQRQFRERMQWFAAHPDTSHRLAHGMTDYIGYALPECRISDAVCQLRPGYLPAPEAAEPRLKVA